MPSWSSPAHPPPLLLGALIVGGLALADVGTAAAQQIQIGGITTAPGTDFSPDARLGLTAALVGDATLSRVINSADCKKIKGHEAPIVRIQWSWLDKPLTLLSPRHGIKIAAPGKTCEGSSMTETNQDSGCKIVASDKSFANPLTAASELTDIDLRDLLGDTDCDVAQEVDARIYFLVTNNTTGVTTTTSVTMNVLIDTKAPAPPVVQTLTAGGQNLRLAWEHVDSAATNYARVYWSKVAFPASAPTSATSRSDELTGTTYAIEGLDNGTTYYVAVTALDANDNESIAAEVREGVPIEVQDFWKYYKASGGTEEGGFGCSAGGGGGGGGGQAAALLLLGLALLLARRAWAARPLGRARVGALAALLTLGLLCAPLGASTAWAESPRTMSLDLRFGYYAPQIDREFASTNGQQPYQTIFGDSALHKGLSIEQILWDGVGDLGVGFGAGWWAMEGKARALDGTASQDKTELVVLPLTLDVVYRFNWLAFKTGFPLIPYLKGGLAYAFWWSNDGNGETSSYQDANNRVSEAQGGVWGLHGVVGMRLLLDPFEPKAARGFDLEWGVNHSYLFVEWQKLSLNDFGSASSIDLSDDVVMFGLGFDL